MTNYERAQAELVEEIKMKNTLNTMRAYADKFDEFKNSYFWTSPANAGSQGGYSK